MALIQIETGFGISSRDIYNHNPNISAKTGGTTNFSATGNRWGGAYLSGSTGSASALTCRYLAIPATEKIYFAADIYISPSGSSRLIALSENNVSEDSSSSTLADIPFRVDYDSTSDQILLYSSNVVQGTSVNAYLSAQWIRVEGMMDKVSGDMKVWINETLEIDVAASAELLAHDLTEINSLMGGYLHNHMGTFAIWNDNNVGDGFHTNLGDWRPAYLLPDADGTELDSTVVGAPTRFEAVNVSPGDDQIYVNLANSGEISTFSMSPLSAEGDTIISVILQPKLYKTTAGEGFFRNYVLSNGVTAQSEKSSSVANTPGLSGYKWLTSAFGTDPNTGLAWTEAGVNAAEFGVKAESGSVA